MGIYEYFATNFGAAAEVTSSPFNPPTAGNAPQDFQLSNELRRLSDSSSTPSDESTSDSSDSDPGSNHSSSQAFRIPLTDGDSDSTNTSSSSSESEANISLTPSDTQQIQDRSSSSGSGDSPKSIYDVWQGRSNGSASQLTKSNESSPDRSASSGRPSPERSAGSSSESSYEEEVLSDSASSRFSAESPTRDNSDQSADGEGSATEGEDNMDGKSGDRSASASTSNSSTKQIGKQPQPQKSSKANSSKGSKNEGSSESSSSSSESSASLTDSSVSTPPVPEETAFRTSWNGTEESYSSVSSSSSEESYSSSSSESSSSSSKSSEQTRDSRQESKSSNDASSKSGSRAPRGQALSTATMEPLKTGHDDESTSSSFSPSRKEEQLSAKGGDSPKSCSVADISDEEALAYLGSDPDEGSAGDDNVAIDQDIDKNKNDSASEGSSLPIKEETKEVKPLSVRSKSSSSENSYEEKSFNSPSKRSHVEEADNNASSSSRSSAPNSRSSLKSFGSSFGSAAPKASHDKSAVASSDSSKSSSSKSKLSLQSFGSPAPKASNEKSLGASPDSSKSSSKSKTSVHSFGPAAPQIAEEMPDVVSTDASSSSSESKKSLHSFGAPVAPLSILEQSKGSATGNAGAPSSRSTDANINFAFDPNPQCSQTNDLSPFDPIKRTTNEKPRPWSDFVPSPDSGMQRNKVDGAATPKHNSDEFRWVPSNDNWYMPSIRTRPESGRSDVPKTTVRDTRNSSEDVVISPNLPKRIHGFDPIFFFSMPQDPQANMGNIPPVPPIDIKMRRKGDHGIPPLSEISLLPRYDEESTLGTEGFHFAPLMYGDPRAFAGRQPQYHQPRYPQNHYSQIHQPRHPPQYPQIHESIPNARQLEPWHVRMSEVLRKEGADPPEVKTDRASSYLQFIHKTPRSEPRGTRQETKTQPAPGIFENSSSGPRQHPSAAIDGNGDFSHRAEASENSWVPTQLKSELVSGVNFSQPQYAPPQYNSAPQYPKDLLYSHGTKPTSWKSSSDMSNWYPPQATQSNGVPSTPAVATSGSSAGERSRRGNDQLAQRSPGHVGFAPKNVVTSAPRMDNSPAGKVPSDDDSSSASSSSSLSMMEVTVHSEPSEPSDPSSQISDESSSSSGSSYHLSDSSSDSSSSSSDRRSRPAVPTNLHRPPIATPNERKPPVVPYLRNQPNTTNDVESQRQQPSGSNKSKKSSALRNAIIAVVVLAVIIAAGVLIFFLTREDESTPVISSGRRPTNRPTTFVPTQSVAPSQSAVPTQSPSLSPSVPTTRRPTPPPTTRPPAPTRPPGDPDVLQNAYYKLIVSKYPQGGDAIQNRSSPQRSAFEWLRSVSNVQDLPENRVLQRYALATLFYSTRGWEWAKASRWLSNEHECSWFTTSAAMDTCNPNREVTILSLRENNLDGTVPAEVFALLPLLEEVQLHGNKVSGAIPTSISNLSSLALFDLSSNQVFSNIPSQLGGLTNLQRIALANNKIFSTIPTEIGRLSLLQTLDLGANQLTGSIPSTMASMASLAGLSLYANYISGTVPRDFSALSNLELIYIDGNYLSGSVGNSLCQLQVREFWADCDRVVCSCCTTCCAAQGCGNN